MVMQEEKAMKTKAFRDQAARQRTKIKGLKGYEVDQQNEDMGA